MTPEQICEVLVKAGVLHRYGESFMRAGEPFAVSPDQAVIDGNVAMAAWEAVCKALNNDCDLLIEAGHKRITVTSMARWTEHTVEGTDTAAFTTACAMALANKEERL